MSGLGDAATTSASRADRWVTALLLVWATAFPIAGAAIAWATADAWQAALPGDVAMSIGVLFAVTTVVTAGSLLPSHVAALVCGYTHGPIVGSIVAWFVVGSAALLGYALARPLVSARAQLLIVRHPRAARVHRALIAQSRGRRIGLVMLLRLSPVMPFALTNFLMAAARVPFVDFQVGSWLGMTPRVVAVACAGAGLATIADAPSSDPRMFAIGVAATLAVLWWIGRVAKRALRERGAA